MADDTLTPEEKLDQEQTPFLRQAIGMPMLPPRAMPTAQPLAMAMPMPGASSGPAMPMDPPAYQPPTKEIPATQRLWNETAKPSPGGSGIQNPVLRGLARTGAGILRGVDIAGETAFPRIAEFVPGSNINTGIRNVTNQQQAEKQQAMAMEGYKAGTEQQKAMAEEEAVKQKPELSELAGEQRGLLQADRENAQENRLTQAQADADRRAQEREQESEKAQTEREASAQAMEGQREQHQDTLETDREAAADRRLLQSLPSKDSARLDRSYQFNSTQLEKERTPVEAQMGKISAALTNANQKTPQADALLAPQILTIAAGGTGSGLRMNQAEINQIVGGATKWTQLQTALNKWSTDPTHATFTDEQRRQMTSILGAAQQKDVQKQQVLEWAENSLVDAEDVKSHRQVLTQARQLLDAVDNGKTLQRNAKTGEIRVKPDATK